MNIKEFKRLVFQNARQKEIDNFELFHTSSHEFECSINKGEIQSYKDAENGGSSFKAVKNGKAGYSYTEDYNEDEAMRIVIDALENLQLIDSDDIDAISTSEVVIKNWKDYSMAFDEISTNKKIADTKLLEAQIQKKDSRIIMVPYCFYNDMYNEVFFANSNEIEYTYKNGGGGMYAGAMASNGKQNKFGMDFDFTTDPQKLDIEKLANSVAEKAVGLLDAKSIKSGKYQVVLNYNVLGNILGLLVQMISAENVQKGFSLLKNKLGEKIVSEKITILDKRYYPDSIFNCPADSQGIVTTDKAIISNGVLNTYLHSLKTALKDGVSPTGNAFRRSYKGTESISPINIDFQEGKANLDDLFEHMKDGLYITGVQGMHSGANPVSGEFSLSAEGFKIEDGKKAYPIEQITLSGNLLRMLQNIQEIGSDKQMAMVMSHGMYVPSVLIKEMDIAGNE
ncbi:MAG TPA: TldD/PmbA family protein [Thermotogota bacterium]|nr:TldD/PmbA family protein [Thermotogota bacterium]